MLVMPTMLTMLAMLAMLVMLAGAQDDDDAIPGLPPDDTVSL